MALRNSNCPGIEAAAVKASSKPLPIFCDTDDGGNDPFADFDVEEDCDELFFKLNSFGG